MTDLATYQPAATVEHFTSNKPMRLIEWAEEARAANMLAKALCRTEFAGQYRGNEDGATAAILKGAEVGLTPVTALGAFDLIQGTPAPKAITLRALVQSHGHAIWIESSTDTQCVAKARRRGEAEIHTSTWTTKRAQQMNLMNKPNWKSQPSAMLIARATSEVCRLVAADVILGIGYSAEELQDEQPEPVVTVTRTVQSPKTVQRRQLAPVPMAEPEFDEPTPELETAEPELRSEAQSRKLFATARDAGISNDDLKPFMSKHLGRDVESSKTLTKAEAARVIDALEQAIPEPDLDLETGEVLA